MKQRSFFAIVFTLSIAAVFLKYETSTYSSDFYGDCVHLTVAQAIIASDAAPKELKRITYSLKFYREIQVQYLMKNGLDRYSAIEAAKEYKGSFHKYQTNAALINSNAETLGNKINQCAKAVGDDSLAKSVIRNM